MIDKRIVFVFIFFVTKYEGFSKPPNIKKTKELKVKEQCVMEVRGVNPDRNSFSNNNPRAKWVEGKYGLMVHWLAPPYTKFSLNMAGTYPLKSEYVWDLNEAVNAFDLKRFMKDFDATGADWLIFTIAQDAGTYPSPNSVVDSLGGPIHTSNRDLVFEIAKAVKKRGKRFIAYLPCNMGGNETLRDAFSWNQEPYTDQAQFQKLYLLAIKEWAIRYGEYLDGWWFDAAYYDRPSFDNKYIQWNNWYEATRAGNQNAIVTFNDGSFLSGYTEPIRPEHDYTSGEELVIIDSKRRLTTKRNGDLWMPKQAYVEGTECLYHVLLPIDGYWWHNRKEFLDWANVPYNWKPDRKGEMPLPIYPDDELIKIC